jgi:hypothetical protein
MSKKKQKVLIVDTGGLDLAAFADISVQQFFGSPDADVVAGDPYLKGILDSIPDGTVPPDVQVLHTTHGSAETQPEPPSPLVEEGLTMLEALARSPYLYMAAAPTPNPDFVVVTRGTFVWVATAKGLEPAAYSWPEFNQETLRSQKIWFPVWGDEKGLYVRKTVQA